MAAPVAAERWVPLAESLADALVERGALHDPAWRDAIRSVPRHVLVPRYYVQNPDAAWREITADEPGYLAEVYTNQPLTTALGGGEPTSSSSQPSLMVRMLETLAMRDGDRVLEIGTGTGYNAGLLAHRLGAENVHSVDIDPTLVDEARARLASLGYRPALTAVDGGDGWAEHAPYDKLIATCSVPAVPWEWARQLRPGGQLLVDLKIGVNAGNLVLAEQHHDYLQGRFVPGWANFMAIRHSAQLPAQRRGPAYEHGAARTTSVAPEPWRLPVVWFVAAFAQPAGLGHGVRFDPETRQLAASFLTAPDGSWCEVGHTAENGRYPVTEYGPTPLWSRVEAADAWWHGAGGPGWERLGLTATRDEQHVWLDHPNSGDRWAL